MANQTKKTDRAVNKAVESLMEVTKYKVSFHLVVHKDGETKSFGTKNAADAFENVRERFEEALIQDIVTMCQPEKADNEPVLSNINNIAPKMKIKIGRLNTKGPELERLPYPLKYMNRKEKLSYLRYLIVYDRQIRLDISATKIMYGQESWEPSFWINDGIGRHENWQIFYIN